MGTGRCSSRANCGREDVVARLWLLCPSTAGLIGPGLVSGCRKAGRDGAGRGTRRGTEAIGAGACCPGRRGSGGRSCCTGSRWKVEGEVDGCGAEVWRGRGLCGGEDCDCQSMRALRCFVLRSDLCLFSRALNAPMSAMRTGNGLSPGAGSWKQEAGAVRRRRLDVDEEEDVGFYWHVGAGNREKSVSSQGQGGTPCRVWPLPNGMAPGLVCLLSSCSCCACDCACATSLGSRLSAFVPMFAL